MKSVVVHAVDHPTFDIRRSYARALAISLGAHLTMCYPIAVYAPVTGDFSGSAFSADFVTRMLEAEKVQADRVQAETAAALQPLGSGWDWAQPFGDAAQLLIDASRLADLVIVGPTAPAGIAGPLPAPVAGTLALHAAAPVLVVPAHECRFEARAPVMIGWNGSAEAARAIKAALPFLKASSQVLVVEIGDDKGAPLPDCDLGSYLARHDVATRMVRQTLHGSVSATLAATAREAGAHMLVIGAYGRPRVIEYVFGGTSHDLLSDPPLPVLMVH